MNCCSFYYTTIKNNATSENSKFGGGISFTDVAAKTEGTDGNVYFNHCTIKGNRNGSHGGGLAFYYNTAADGRNVYMKDTEISYNCQKSFSGAQIEAHGGGLWVVNAYDSDVTKQRRVFFDNCSFIGNYANGKTAAGGAISNEGTIELTSCAFNNNVADNSFGGAIYNRPQMSTGNNKGVDLTLSGCSFTGNQATWSGDLSIDANDPNSNPTRGSGGAIMIDIFRLASYPVEENFIINLDIEDNCTFTNNHADRSGGAIAVAASADMESWLDNPPAGHGTLTSNMEIKSATMSGNTAGKSGVTWPTGRGNYGGAIFLSYTNLSVTGNNSNVQIKNNGNVNSHTATQYGGAVAIYKGDLTLSGGTFGASGNGNKATHGGAFYINQGTVSLNGGLIDYNAASEQGGGLYATGNGSITVNGVTMSNNTAKSGGGIFTNNSAATNFNMSNGTISGNSATNGNGGGVCLDANTTLNLSGTGSVTGNSVDANHQGGGIYMGGAMTIDGTSLNVSGNTMGGNVNNVYLPHDKKITVGANISPNVTMGIYTERTVDGNNGNDIPVLNGNTGKLWSIYNAMISGTSNIRDDRGIHQAKYTQGNSILYFGKVNFDFGPYSTDFSNPIDSKEKLYQFMCWVNGLNGYGEKHSDALGNVTADIDMSTIQYWYPIGEHNVVSNTSAYTGNFKGNGHIISGLSNVAPLIEDWGLFGSIGTGALVEDVFVQRTNLNKTTDGSLACLVGKMVGGTVRNCTASGTITSTYSTCVSGGLVGKQQGGTVHSSSTSANITGYTMGGLAGTNAGNIYNSFANPQFTHSGSGTEYMGGLVAVNTGRIENCYSRVRGTIPTGNFGYLAGANHVTSGETTTNGTLTYCYAPTEPYTVAVGDGTQSYLDCYNPVIAPYKYNHGSDNTLVTANTSNLLDELNRWVEGHSGYSPWKRTTAGGYSTGAGNINGDYPIHKHAGYTTVASTDGIALDYAATLDAMLSRHTSNTTVNLYANDNTTASTGNGVVVYIDEEVSLLQDVGLATPTSSITAYTGQTLRNFSSNANRWHNVSSSLKQSGIGFDYTNSQYATFNWSINPCNIALSGDNDNAFFPSDMPWPATAQMDFYCFYEPEYHWINLKRRTDSHWHMDATDVPIAYNGNGIGANTNGNETYLVPGKGYLVSIDKDQLIQNKGELNNGTVTLYSVTKTDANEWAGLLGYNLLGNPYQSYLDFEVFKTTNSGLWTGENEYNQTYATFDPEQNAYRQYFGGTSSGATVASRYIHPHQGFFIRKTAANSGNNTVTFTNAMRTNATDSQSGFRGAGQPRHALVNFVVRDAQGNGDIAVLELNRDGDEGAEKIRMGDGMGHVSLGYDGKAYAILFRTKVDGYQPLWFEATEAGTFTLRWDIHNAVFESLTLVDNITGTSTDMLASDTYIFQGSPDHYASRFKVVIGDYVEVDPDAPSVPEPVEGPTFAFQMGDQLVVNGEGTLQVFDVTGRQLVTQELYGSQSRIAKPTTAGVYLLRLTDGNGTRTQKIVVE